MLRAFIKDKRMKQIRIVKTGINGEGIGYEHHKPVFVKGALIDETVQYEADHLSFEAAVQIL
jgi:tRNA/tmRNA/rRNA uracil-C5-methylase (TrmA/RlmC/RlmD family)